MSNAESDKIARDGRPEESLAEAARHEASEVGDAAASAGRELAEEARQVAATTAEQGKQRAAGQLDRLASALQTSTRELGPDDAWLTDVVRRTAVKLKSASRHLHDQDLRGLAREASELARTHPATFLGASVALGFAAARLAKANDSTGTTTSGTKPTSMRQGASE